MYSSWQNSESALESYSCVQNKIYCEFEKLTKETKTDIIKKEEKIVSEDKSETEKLLHTVHRNGDITEFNINIGKEDKQEDKKDKEKEEKNNTKYLLEYSTKVMMFSFATILLQVSIGLSVLIIMIKSVFLYKSNHEDINSSTETTNSSVTTPTASVIGEFLSSYNK